MLKALTVEPVTLTGTAVRLEPLSHAHADDLLRAAADPAIWRFMPIVIADDAGMAAWIDTALKEQEAGVSLPFAIINRATGAAIGGTRLMDIRPRDRGVEIGWTWIDSAYWRSPINTECKFLLFTHAFETMGAIRVQFKTHRLNQRSRNAIERLGAQFEGILRNQFILPDGTYRDSAYYSVIESEWPAVRRAMALMLAERAERA